jgi:hypothetical protein
MAKLNMKFPHQLSQEDALKRSRGLLDEVKNQFADQISNLSEKWEENTCQFSFSVKGFSVSGTLTVKPSEVELSGDLPWAATFFRGKIESTIRERAETLLA